MQFGYIVSWLLEELTELENLENPSDPSNHRLRQRRQNITYRICLFQPAMLEVA